MSVDLSGSPKVVGAKQTRRAVEAGRARLVLLAADADPRVTGPILALCEEKGVETARPGSMKELGQAFGIAVGCAVAALLA